MNIRLIRLSICLLTGSVLLNPRFAHATTLRDLPLNEKVAASDDIVVGTCEKSEAIWIGKKIYTVCTIRVSQTAKGKSAPGMALTVHTLGGKVSLPMPVEMFVEGAAQMRVGEEMVLFLEKYGDKKQYQRTVGMAQGKVTVTANQKTGVRGVNFGQPVRSVKRADVQGKAGEANANRQEPQAEPNDTSPLDDFMTLILTIKTEQNAEIERETNSNKGQKGAE